MSKTKMVNLGGGYNVPPGGKHLPAELLGEIFVYCLPEGGPSARLSQSEAPFSMLRVCREWENVALDTRRLWSSLCIDVRTKPEEQVDGRPLEAKQVSCVQLTRKRLSLARGAPLSISFTSTSPSRRRCIQASAVDHWLAQPMLQPFLPRVASLSVSIFDQTGYSLLPSSHPKQGDFILLGRVRSLKLQLHRPDGDTVFVEGDRLLRILVRTLALNSNLRHFGLAIDCNHGWPDPNEFVNSIPWANLESLDLRQPARKYSTVKVGIRKDVLLPILNQCSSLRRLWVTVEGDMYRRNYSWDLNEVPDASVPTLRQLYLECPNFKDGTAASFLSQCEFPNLSVLHILSASLSHVDEPFEPEQPRVLTVVVKWNSPLTSLTVVCSNAEVPTDALTTFIGSFGTLLHFHLVIRRTSQHLELDTGKDDPSQGNADKLLEAFIPSKTTDNDISAICPRLQCLCWEGDISPSDSVVKDLLLERASSEKTERMRTVSIVFNRPMKEDVSSACAGLVASGLELHLKYPEAQNALGSS